MNLCHLNTIVLGSKFALNYPFQGITDLGDLKEGGGCDQKYVDVILFNRVLLIDSIISGETYIHTDRYYRTNPRLLGHKVATSRPKVKWLNIHLCVCTHTHTHSYLFICPSKT